ncbi:MAG: leucine-rich repeat domain-containing protein [Saprospirales bacterium]|nr:leucine-rich repeat domain-containing protein [Saprospirales bacterium]
MHMLPDSPGKWPALQQLGLQHNALAELPDAFARLPRLKELLLGRNRFVRFPESLVASSSLEKVSGVAGASRAIRFMQACQQADLPEAYCLALFSLCCGNIQPESVPPEILSQGLRLPLPSLQKTIRAYLLQRKSLPIDPSKAIVGLVGRTRLSKSAWKERLEKAGIQMTMAPGSGPTHVILGGGIIEIPEGWLRKNVTFLEEATLFQYIQHKEQRYLHQLEDHGQLGRLLQSKQPGSLRLALTLLKNGGVPPTVMTDLYLAWKTAPEPTLKKRFRDLLLLHASESGRRF